MAQTLVESLFGFKLRLDPTDEEDKRRIKSPFPAIEDDGALFIADGAGAYTSTFLDYGRLVQNEIELITKYRQMAMHPEVDRAIDHIVNEMCAFDSDGLLVDIDLTQLDEMYVPDIIKQRITAEYKKVYQKLKFNLQGYNIVRKWYTDGRIYFHIMIDEQNPLNGIFDVRFIDPRKIKLIKRERKTLTHTAMVPVHDRFEEFFLYNPNSVNNIESGIKIATDAIAYCHSGLFDDTGQIVLGQLHKALKILNQMKWMEDALVIYRLARAPERRVFQIDVAGIPPAKAQQYVENIKNKHINKQMYNTTTGEIDTERRFLTMLDDFYVPVRDGRGTSITTQPGGQNLGEVTDVEYFAQRLHQALNVPSTRMKQDSLFNSGRPSEITRDEVLFQKFIDRQREAFSQLFNALLRVQLVLKGICSLSEWQKWAPFVRYDYKKDNTFAEMKDNELLQQRLQILTEIDPYVMKYYSPYHVKTKILKQSDEEIKQLQLERDEAEATGEAKLFQTMGMGMDPMMGGMPMDGGMLNTQDPNTLGLPPPDGSAGFEDDTQQAGRLGGNEELGFGTNVTSPKPKKKIFERINFARTEPTEDARHMAKLLFEHRNLEKCPQTTVDPTTLAKGVFIG